MIFKYELKKILNNKVNMVAMLAGYISLKQISSGQPKNKGHSK